MIFTTQLNPSTKCREVFGVDETTGASFKVAVVPPSVNRVYADLIEAACGVVMTMHPSEPQTPLQALPELLFLTRMAAAIEDAEHDIACGLPANARETLRPYSSPSCDVDAQLLVAKETLYERRRAILAKLKGVHAPQQR